MRQPLVQIEKASAFIPGEKARPLVLREISWRIAGHVAIIGSNGAGKSSLLRLVHGDLRPCAGKINWLDHGYWTSSAIAAREITALVSPQIQAQCQLHAWDVSGAEMLAGAASGAPLAFAAGVDAHMRGAMEELLRKMDALPLLHMRLPQLSQGQLRLLFLARALLARPKLLLLDEWADGLDKGKRRLLAAVLREHAGGMFMVFTGHRQDAIPDWVKERLYMQGGRLLNEQPAGASFQQADNGTEPQTAKLAEKPQSQTNYANMEVVQGKKQTFVALPHSLQNFSADNRKLASATTMRSGRAATLIRLRNASVYIDGAPVLHEINWELKKGEHWHIEGANGSGKSTFLRLLAGDEFVAAGGVMRIYSARTGKEIKTLAQKRHVVSLVSDLEQALYGYALTGLELVLSGCEMSVGNYREFSAAEKQRAARLLQMFFETDEWQKIADASIRRLSSGQLKRLFLTRALMSGPEVLLLDEPCSGLDAASRGAYLEMLGRLAQAENGPQIVFVSHYAEDVPGFVNRSARMEKGELAVEPAGQTC